MTKITHYLYLVQGARKIQLYLLPIVTLSWQSASAAGYTLRTQQSAFISHTDVVYMGMHPPVK